MSKPKKRVSKEIKNMFYPQNQLETSLSLKEIVVNSEDSQINTSRNTTMKQISWTESYKSEWKLVEGKINKKYS